MSSPSKVFEATTDIAVGSTVGVGVGVGTTTGAGPGAGAVPPPESAANAGCGTNSKAQIVNAIDFVSADFFIK
jgi:hypothetical protein